MEAHHFYFLKHSQMEAHNCRNIAGYCFKAQAAVVSLHITLMVPVRCIQTQSVRQQVLDLFGFSNNVNIKNLLTKDRASRSSFSQLDGEATGRDSAPEIKKQEEVEPSREGHWTTVTSRRSGEQRSPIANSNNRGQPSPALSQPPHRIRRYEDSYYPWHR